MAWNIDRPKPIWVKTPKQVAKLKQKFENIRSCAIDTETTGLNIVEDEIMFWSLSFGDDRYFLEREMLDEFEKVFADRNRIWVGTHTKYDAHMLANAGMPLRGQLWCTLVMDRLLNPDNDHGLKEVYEREFDEKMATFGETFYPKNVKGKPYKPRDKTMEQTMWEAWDNRKKRVIDYASMDAWGSWRIYERLRSYLEDIMTWRGESLWDLYHRFEIPFTKVLYTMERIGIQIDVPYLQSLEPKIEEEQHIVAKELVKRAGQIINVNSPKQLRALFFDKLKMPIIKKTKSGAPSTDEFTLSTYAKRGCEEAKLVLRYRKLGKIRGTYVKGIVNKVDRHSRVHGSFNQHVADTGRLSSSDPNLQNIPRPDSDEFKIRKAFIARKGYKYCAADYDQVELFLTAHFSGDASMIQAITDGKDLHAANAAEIWQEPYEDIVAAKKKDPDKEELTPRDWTLREYRQFEKIVVFGQVGRNKTCSKRGNLSAAA